MTDTPRKISELTELTTPAADDYLPIVDVSETTLAAKNKRIKPGALVGQAPFTQSGTGAVARTVESKLRDVVSVKDFGVVGDGSTDDRPAIQAAIDYINSIGGGIVYIPRGTYVIGGSGSFINGREYGLLLKSGVVLKGESMPVTTLKAKNSSSIDLINTVRPGPVINVGVIDLKLDGNEANQGASPANGFNLWLYNATDALIQRVYSLNPSSWGIRPELCTRLNVQQITCVHSAESNSDGIHFVDCDDVFGGDIWVSSAGDDGFIIEALSKDIKNYTLSGIYVKALNELALPARGILLFSDQTIAPALRKISNINLSSCVVESASGHGVIMTEASFENVAIDAVVRGECSFSALSLYPGSATYPAGILENCRLNITASDLTGSGCNMITTYGTFRNNYLDLYVSNPGNNKTGAIVKGDNWSGSIQVDYNPNGDKTSSLSSIDFSGDYCDFAVSALGGNYGLNLQGTAQNNTFRIGYLKDGVTGSLSISGGAIGNTFVGGVITGAVANSGGPSNKFVGCIGATGSSDYATQLNMATEADGTALIPHGLKGTPARASVQHYAPDSTTPVQISVIGLTSTNIDVRVVNLTGAAITSGTVQVFWNASL